MSKKRPHLGESITAHCYCKSGLSFDLCCHPLLIGSVPAETAERLMRSRYTAFCLHKSAYLLHTWHPTTRPASIEFDAKQHWLGLKIVTSQAGKVADLQGQVEFIARYKVHGQVYRLHEKSDFLRQDGRWYYTQGSLLEQQSSGLKSHPWWILSPPKVNPNSAKITFIGWVKCGLPNWLNITKH